MPLERAVVQAVIRELEARGAWVITTHGSVMGRAGIPDVIACLDGRMLGVECKQPGRHPTRLQRHELRSIDRAGGLAVVAHSRAELARALDEDSP